MQFKMTVALSANDLIAAHADHKSLFAVGVCSPGSSEVVGNVALMEPEFAEQLLAALFENRVAILPHPYPFEDT